MTTTELVRANELADSLIPKLERINALLAGTPTAEDLENMARAAGSIASSLQEASDIFNSDEFPRIEDADNSLDIYSRLAAEIASSLQEVADTFNSDEFPTAVAVKDIAK